ncbi:MAG: cyclic nucleotide-binding domain-containing protein [Proteobacteria bacterium]|nr:cyclic nucleotide-binding domain-containing protein [Pseudomonadota bacterium]MCP4919340.1 cyclic nucleotide-binding domain-containing protein [Pseudomonadota bacterium]
MIAPTADAPPSIPNALLDGPLFAGVTADHRSALLSRLPWYEVAGGVQLFEEGEPGEILWILLSGTVTLTRQTECEDTVELDRARTGDAFGELAVISPASRFATATTVGPCTLVSLTRAQFRKLIEQRAPAAEALLRYLTRRICRRLRQVDGRIALVHDALHGARESVLRKRALELDRLGEY